MTATRRGHDDRGSISLEFTLIAPVFLLLIALVLAYARLGQVSATLDAGVRDAARSATQTGSAAAAQDQARQVILGSLTSGDCAETLTVAPVTEFLPGRAVTITATCSYRLSDLGLPGAPGQVTVRSSFASPLDPNRVLS